MTKKTKEKKPKTKTVKGKKKKPQAAKDKKETKVSKKKPHIEPQTMEELLDQIGDKKLGVKREDTVKGTVVSKSSKEILIDIGKKSYGIVAQWELEQVRDYAKTLKVGDKVTAQVRNPENEYGYVILSLRKASSQRRWKFLKEIQEKGKDIEVKGVDVAKGGILVEWQNLKGFIPASQLDPDYASKPSTLIGQLIKVKVLEVDKSLNRLVLSQKAATLGLSPSELKEKLSKVKPEQVLKGRVSGIVPFGIFVDINGLEGLVHISEIAWEKVENPASRFKVGDEIEVMILEVNQEEGKLNLSMKRLTPDPWKNILDKYPVDSTVKGEVVRIAPYGIFVQIEPGIEGLIHISKMGSGKPSKVGEEIECIIESIDPSERKISLSLLPTEVPVSYR